MYPLIETYENGLLAVGEGNRVFWGLAGNPSGKTALVLHGGPGSGCSPWYPRLFDPEVYRVVLVDQRGCGRSLPNATDPRTDLTTNTTGHLLRDIEALREHLGVGRWLVLGGSWGSTLALAYAEMHPRRVSELVLFSLTTTSGSEVDWATRGIGSLLPAEWARFHDFLPALEHDDNLAAAYARLLADPDPDVRRRAAYEWCRWDDAQSRAGTDRGPDPRFENAAFRNCFSRLVTHYWANAAFLPEGALLDGAVALAGIPGSIVHGEDDLGCPPDRARELSSAWPDADLVILPGAGHGRSDPMSDALVAATDRFAGRVRS